MTTRILFLACLGVVALGIGWDLGSSSQQIVVGPVSGVADVKLSPSARPESEPRLPFINPPAKAPTDLVQAVEVGAIGPREIAALIRLRTGQGVVFPLPDGTTLPGQVRCVRQEIDGWTRAGGVLDGGATFSLSARDGDAAGRILIPGENRAWQIRRSENGVFTWVGRSLQKVLCVGLPRSGRIAAPVEEADADAVVPLFDSRPSATAVLYLDFDGATVSDPDWAGGTTILAPRARLGAKSILKVCQRVAGDYASFDIDISTDAARYASTPVGHRMRAIVTRNDAASPGAGGVAYVGTFAHDSADGFSPDIPCWVFEDAAVDTCAEALSHELGHTLGLDHDGRDFPNGRHQEYYAGQGSGSTGWAPIMGIPYYRRLSQWSKGEYRYANNQQDDVAIIANGKNGFGFVADEAGDTRASAADLAVVGPIVDQHGVIANVQDIDVFRFSTEGGKLGVRVRPTGRDGNIDLRLELLADSGTVLQSNNPPGGLAASLQRHLAAGTYFLRISGVGKGTPLRNGYTNYGSIGAYHLTGKINGLAAPLSGVGQNGAPIPQ